MATMTKILHLITSMQQGGAERQLATIVNHSHAVTNYICSFREMKAWYLLDPNAAIVLGRKSLWGRIHEFRVLLLTLKPDLVYTWGVLPYILASLTTLGKTTKVVNGSIRHGIFKKSWQGFFRLVLLQLSKYIVANSAAGLQANRLKRGYILYNGIDPKFDQRNWPESKNRNTGQCLNLISVANMMPYKDYFTTLEVLRILKSENYNFLYRIIGEGPLRAAVEREVLEKGLDDRVILLGNINNPEEYLSISDIFIHSSKGEGCSNAILEAMYMGLPVIASNTGGTPEIVGDNAILFKYQNVEELYKALKQVMEDKELRKKMAEASYSIASTRFSLLRMLEDYQQIIQQIVES